MSGTSGGSRVATDVDGCLTLWTDADRWWIAEHARGTERVHDLGRRPAPEGLATGAHGGSFIAWSSAAGECLRWSTDGLEVTHRRALPADVVDLAVVAGRVGGRPSQAWCCLDAAGRVHRVGDTDDPDAIGDAGDVVVPGARALALSRRLRRLVVLGETVAVLDPHRPGSSAQVLGRLPLTDAATPVVFDEVLETLWWHDADALVATALRDDALHELYRVPVAPGVTGLQAGRGGEWLLVRRETGDDTVLNVAARRELSLPAAVADAPVRAFGFDARLCALSEQGVLAAELPARAELRAVEVGLDSAGWIGRMTKTSSVALRRGTAPARRREETHA